jgi:hypothetical protein
VQRGRGQGPDGRAGRGGQLLLGHAHGAGARDAPAIGHEQAGENVQQRGLAATVLADHRQA